MPFLQVYDALPDADKAAAVLSAVRSDPDGLFAELLAAGRILVSPGPAAVALHADCVEVLGRPDDFTVSIYAPRMERVTGPFILGEDGTELYDRDAAALTLALRREDLPGVRSILRRLVDRAIAEATADGQGELDAVAAASRRVPAELVGEYLGVPGPNTPTLQGWARELFRVIFTKFDNRPETWRKADMCAGEMRTYVDDLVRQRQTAGTGGATVLDRLVALGVDGEPCVDAVSVRHNLIGLVTGAIDTTSRAVVNVLVELFARPDALAAATAAAARDDECGLAGFCLEALRLRPQTAMLVRVTGRECTVAAGTSRATRIPAGRLVFVGTGAAMRDPTVFERPDQFDQGRARSDHLHFGSGPHRCRGRYVAQAMIVEIVRGLLRIPGFRALDGGLEMDCSFPAVLRVGYGDR